MDYPLTVHVILAVLAALAMSVCQLAIGHVFDDNDYVNGGNGTAHEISQKPGSRQDSICASAGESTLSCNNPSDQTQTNATVDNAEDQQENDSGIKLS